MSSSLELGLSVRVLSYCSHFTSVLVYTAAAAQTAHTLLLAAPPKAVLCSPCCLCHMAIFTSHPALQDIIFVARRPVLHHLFIYFFCSLVRWREVYNHAGFFNHRFQRYTDTQRKMLQPFTNLSLWKELCKKQPLDKVLASGFDFFSTLSASMMQYYLSGDTYHLGENCSVFLCLIGGYKWLHLCDDCGAASEATTAEGIWAP